MKRFFQALFYENGSVSLTRVIAGVGLFAFLAVSFYLAFTGLHWDDYGTFASYTGGGGTVTQLANKFINSKYNSPQGGYTPVEEKETK